MSTPSLSIADELERLPVDLRARIWHQACMAEIRERVLVVDCDKNKKDDWKMQSVCRMWHAMQPTRYLAFEEYFNRYCHSLDLGRLYLALCNDNVNCFVKPFRKGVLLQCNGNCRQGPEWCVSSILKRNCCGHVDWMDSLLEMLFHMNRLD